MYSGRGPHNSLVSVSVIMRSGSIIAGITAGIIGTTGERKTEINITSSIVKI